MTTLARCLSVMLIVTLTCGVATPTWAQEGDGDRGAERGERGDRGERRDRSNWRERWENASEEEREQMRAEWRKRMEERRAEQEKRQSAEMQERLGIEPEEFEVIKPLIDNVRQAMRDRDSLGRSQRGGSSWTSGREQPDAVKEGAEALAELRQAIEDDNSGDIKDALKKLRKARAEMDKAVADARAELRSVCSAKWEAQFVMMGILD